MTRLAFFVIALLSIGPVLAQAQNQAPPEQGLDFEKKELPKAEFQAVTQSGSSEKEAIVAIAILGAIIAACAWLGARAGDKRTLLYSLSSLPYSAKLLFSFVIGLYALTHILAAMTVYQDTRIVYSSAAEYFRFLSPARLTGLSHAHLMSIATMDGLLGTAYVLSRRSSGWVSLVVALTFVGIIGDIASWWLTKYRGSGFELLSMVTGVMFSIGFILMSMSTLRDMWLSRQAT